MKRALWLIGALLPGAAVLAALLALFRWAPTVALGRVIPLGIEAVVLIACTSVILKVSRPSADLQTGIGLRATHPGLVLLSLALGAVAYLATAALEARLVGRFPITEGQLLWRSMRSLDAGGVTGTATLVLASTVLPFVREALLRGALFDAIRRGAGANFAIVACAAGGALLSWDARAVPAVFLVGLMLGRLRHATGSLMPCLAFHVVLMSCQALAERSGAASAFEPMRLTNVTGLMAWVVLLGGAMIVDRGSDASEDVAAAREADRSDQDDS